MLGGSWLAWQAPRDLNALCVRALEAGFDGPMPGPTEPQVDWDQLLPCFDQLPIRVDAVRAHAPAATDGEPAVRFAALSPVERGRAWSAISTCASQAERLRIRTVVLEPGRVEVDGERTASDLGDRSITWNEARVQTLRQRFAARRERHLDLAIRALHALLQIHSEMHFALTGSFDLLGLGEPGALVCILEDLHSPRLSYWHDCGVAWRRQLAGLEPHGHWLDLLHKWLGGVTWSDATASEVLLPPGAGGVDYSLVASYIKRLRGGLPGVVELHPSLGAQDVRNARSSLRRFGV